MLALTALCGEVPSSQFLRIPGSTSQKRKALTRLKKAGLLYPYSQNRLRGYRLSKEAKSYLLSAEPGKFDFFLTGYGDYDWVKGEIGKRIRYNRIAQTLTTMLNADVLVHRAEKAEVFAPAFTEAETLYVPAFYTAREVKAIGDDAIKIRGSRMVGVLLADTGAFMVYNYAGAVPQFSIQSECRAKAMIEHIVCHRRLHSIYREHDLHAILFGDSPDMVVQLWAAADKHTLAFLFRESGYEHFYYLTNDHCGEVQLKVLCDVALYDALHAVLLQSLTPAAEHAHIDCDAFDGQGRPVLFACLPDLLRLHRFLGALSHSGQQGHIICFDHQTGAFRQWGGEIGYGPGPELPSLTVPVCVKAAFWFPYGPASMLACSAALLGLLLYERFSGSQDGYDGERPFAYTQSGTYGTSGWMSKREMKGVLDLVGDLRKRTGVILGTLDRKAVCMPVDSPLNSNIAVYGASGSMKIRSFCMNRILQGVARGESLIITDPKSELYEKSSEYLRAKGYTVKVFNLVSPQNSDSWNCLAEVEGQELTAQLFVDAIIRNTAGSGKGDRFWDSAFDFLASLFISFVFIKLVRYADRCCEGGHCLSPFMCWPRS